MKKKLTCAADCPKDTTTYMVPATLEAMQEQEYDNSNVIQLHPEFEEQEGGNKKIEMFVHCALCCEEVPEGVSMQEFELNECGWTEKGFQVWCRRHDANVIHVDFEGQKHKSI